MTVELSSRLGTAVDASARDRLWGLAWRVADVDAARARVAAAGFEVTAARDGHKPGTRVCSIDRGAQVVPTLLIQAG